MSNSSQEVEKFLSALLKKTIFEDRTYAVGGYVRDEYLGLEPKDLDVVVDMDEGSEKIVQFIFSRLGKEKVTTPVQMGNYPIWQITFRDNVKYKGQNYDVDGTVVEFVVPMRESYPDDASRQRNVEIGTLEEDVRRRDFTANMLYKNITSGEIKDFSGTSKFDIDNGILRTHPEVLSDKIFSDDPLRMLRLIRFKCKNDWEVPEELMESVKRNAQRIDIVSRERIMEELRKIMLMGKLKEAIVFMDDTDLLPRIFPEVDALKNVKQDERHHPEGDVFKHTLLVLDNAKPTVEAQMAALLHDVGKLDTYVEDEKGIHFYGHDDSGAKKAEEILRRLKFDGDTINKISDMIELHMRPHRMDSSSSKAIRKFIRDAGDNLENVLDLAEADQLGREGVSKADIPDLREKIRNMKISTPPVTDKTVLTGEEIMELLNIPAGRKVGEVKKFLIDLQDDYAVNGEELSREDARQAVLDRFSEDLQIEKNHHIRGRRYAGWR